MKDPDQQKPTFATRIGDKTWNLLASLTLLIGLVGALLLAGALRTPVIPAVIVFLALCGVAAFKSLATEPGLRYIWFPLVLPVALGISLTIYLSGDPWPVFIGLAAAFLASRWLLVWRYPSQLRAAAKALQSGEYMQALNLLNQALQVRPSLWEAYQMRAVTYLKLSNSAEAERDARKALQLKPDQHVNVSTLGNVLSAQGKFAEAEELYTRALELAPQVALNYYNKGAARYRRGDFPAAVRYLQIAADKGLRGDALLLGNYYLAQSLSKTGNADRAQRYYDAMKKHRAIYDKLAKEAADAPDYPGVIAMRAEYEDMRRYME